jgi:hypothetical protein
MAKQLREKRERDPASSMTRLEASIILEMAIFSRLISGKFLFSRANDLSIAPDD